MGEKHIISRNPGMAGKKPRLALEDGEIVPRTGRCNYSNKAFKKMLANDPNTPSWMRQWLKQGKSPPGYQVHHKEPVRVGGANTFDNLQLIDNSMHYMKGASWRQIYGN